jgi:hypothetical protein
MAFGGKMGNEVGAAYCFTDYQGYGRAIARIRRFPPRRSGFDPRSGHVGFVVDKVTLGQVLSEYIGFPCQFSFHRLLYTHHLTSGAGTIGQQWLTYQVDSVSPHPKKLKKQEGLGRTNRLLSLIRYGPHWKRRVQKFFYCCACIRYRGNVSTEPLRWAQVSDISTKFHKDWFRDSNVNRGDTQTHRQQRDLIGLLNFFKWGK